MKKSKLLELLQSFQPDEFRQFCDYVASPYYNKNQDLIDFALSMEKWAPSFPADEIKKEAVFASLYPHEPFSKTKMASLMNSLLRLGEAFLAAQRQRQETVLNNCYVLEEFTARKLDKHYHFLYQKTRRELYRPDQQESQAFYHQYLLAQVATSHFYSKQIRKFDPSLQSACDELDKFYFFHKLKYSCEMLNRQAIIKADYRLTFVEEVKSYLLRQTGIDPLIDIYLHIFLSLSYPEEESYFKNFMDLFERHALNIDRKTRRELYLYAINYCARNIRKEEKYTSIMLDLYMRGIQNKSLFDDDYLSHWTYSNVVKLALRLRHYTLAESFIKENRANLPFHLRKDAEHYNLAELYFYKGEFDLVLTHLNQLHFTDLHYHLGSRVILLKTYLELDAEEPLLSLLASFTIYLRRNKMISSSMKKNCLNFCTLLHQILRRDTKKWQALGQEINTTQPLAERAWLLEVWNKMR